MQNHLLFSVMHEGQPSSLWSGDLNDLLMDEAGQRCMLGLTMHGSVHQNKNLEMNTELEQINGCNVTGQQTTCSERLKRNDSNQAQMIQKHV